LRLRSLRTAGWRNLEPLRLDFDPAARLHVLHGDNGQGKTNVLEAVYYLAAFRSFRTTRAFDLVQRGAARADIGLDVETRDLVRAVDVALTVSDATGRGRARDADDDGAGGGGPVKVTRVVRVDGKGIRRIASAFGLASVVLFVPEDLLLVRAPPAARRRFIDLAISGVETTYFDEAAAFQRVLRSRNALLRGNRGGVSPTLLDTYDEQLARAGARLVMRRRSIVEMLRPRVAEIFRSLHSDLPVALAYVSDDAVAAGGTEPAVATALHAGLQKRRRVDELRGHTTFGPQTDDLEIRLDNRPAREHASQGQLRSLVLSMKLAELGNVEAGRGEAPILLLDDVPSELDPTRRRYLFETLAGLSCQTVVSVADPAVVPPLAGRADFRVVAGRLAAVPVFPLQRVP
jgi:DNA replication and repair protein RecF